jgi:hypothetical protein|tara:strand:- start:1807 stop:2073 length:267 start_codon:yes stop_codon:yes gene_type:complete
MGSQQKEEEKMKARKEILEELHGTVAVELLNRIRNGEARPADMANAIKFLKDNGIEGLPIEGSPLGNLLSQMPFPTKDQLVGTKVPFS